MKIEFGKTTQAHVDFLKNNLRAVDLLEIQASHGMSAAESLQLGLELSTQCHTLLADEEPIAIFGVTLVSQLPKTGCPWLLASDKLPKHTREVVLFSKWFIERMLGEYRFLINYADVRNEKTIRWLKWCGFKFEDPAPYGFEGRLFRRFTMGV